MWIFGYGSLVWRPAFRFLERRPATVTGWTRRFWQGSTDHRGVPGRPGRVVTLVEEPGVRCWGMAYRVRDEHWQTVMARLDHREQGGYERREVTLRLHDRESEPVPAVLYLATPENPNYLGPAPMPVIAEQVRGARGPSGENVEYVLELAAALRRMGAADAHVYELEALVTDAAARS